MLFLLLTASYPALAYSSNNNMWVSNGTTCGASNVDQLVSTNSTIASHDSKNNYGYWGWQVEVNSTVGPHSFQWIVNIKSYEISDFYIQYLNYHGYDSSDLIEYTAYHPGNASYNTKVEVDGASNSTGFVGDVDWWVWVCGTVAQEDIIAYKYLTNGTYDSRPQSYQDILVTDDAASSLTFTSGNGYFTYNSGDVVNTPSGCTPGWGAAEPSNMQYASSFTSCIDSNEHCNQNYWAPSG